MRIGRIVFVLSTTLVLVSATVRGDRPLSFVYSRIDIPGAVFANAQRINAAGQVVGIYRDASGRTHGYVWTEGDVATIDYPGASFTEARGIGPGGEIVGDYRMPGEPAVNFHGYRLSSDGVFTQVDYPDHTNTIAQRVLPNGTILGCRHDYDLMVTMRGVAIKPNGENAEIDEFASMHNGASPDGRRIV
jgi:probable HAF family extracellular repeat protein